MRHQFAQQIRARIFQSRRCWRICRESIGENTLAEKGMANPDDLDDLGDAQATIKNFGTGNLEERLGEEVEKIFPKLSSNFFETVFIRNCPLILCGESTR
jgi:hypothetical protein